MVEAVELHVERAQARDAEAVHRLRRQIEDWLQDRGIQQWSPGEISRQEIAEQIGDGQWHLLRESELGLAAAWRVLREDPDIWGPDTIPAVYVHGLMVDRRAAGRGLGASILRWVAEHGRAGGAEVFRLDCGESNGALRAFYRRQGFTEVGRRDFEHGWFSVTLFEQPLAGRGPRTPGN